MKPKRPRYKGHFPSLAAVLQVKPGAQSSGLLISGGIQPGSYKTQETNSAKGGWAVGKNSVLWLG